MGFDTSFHTIPIVMGVIFGCIFLIFFLCIICRLCGGMNRSQSRLNPTVVGQSTVADINSQFNQPLPAPGPYQTFTAAPYQPSAPAEIYQLDPRHQYPSAQGPHQYPAAQSPHQYPSTQSHHQYPSAQSHPTHQQNIYNGQLSTATFPPMPQSDAPPSYNEVIASS